MRVAHGRVEPEGVNEKMLTIHSHQHQLRHEDGGDGRSMLGKVMEMSTLVLISANGIVQKTKKGCENRRFFPAVWTAERGEGTFSYTARAGLPECGWQAESQSWTIIYQIGTDVA